MLPPCQKEMASLKMIYNTAIFQWIDIPWHLASLSTVTEYTHKWWCTVPEQHQVKRDNSIFLLELFCKETIPQMLTVQEAEVVSRLTRLLSNFSHRKKRLRHKTTNICFKNIQNAWMWEVRMLHRFVLFTENFLF